MNKARRKQIGVIINTLEQTKSKLSSICDEEIDVQDNMPENLQDGEVFQESERCSDCMDTALESLGEAIDALEEI